MLANISSRQRTIIEHKPSVNGRTKALPYLKLGRMAVVLFRSKLFAKPKFENQPFDVTWANKKGGISAVRASFLQTKREVTLDRGFDMPRSGVTSVRS